VSNKLCKQYAHNPL